MTKNEAIAKPTNKWIWLLAFAPLIGLLIESLIAEAVEKPIDNFWFITIFSRET